MPKVKHQNQKVSINSPHSKLTGAKKYIFHVILISIPFILLLLVEIFLRIINYGDDYTLFIDFPGKDVQQHKIINPVVGEKYFQTIESTNPCHDMFLKKKPENGFRIFVLGSSSVLGFPYDENLMFTRILQERLQDCYPEKHIEVINTALTAINSFTLLDFMDDILEEEPDAILIYAGHNEFYGALGVGSAEKSINNRTLTLVHLDLLSLKFYQLFRNIINGIGKINNSSNSEKNIRGSLMKVIAKNKEIPYKGETYNKAIELYEKNLGAILQKAQNKNIPVFISELVSNVRDLKPFCSTSTSGYSSAMESYEEAVQLDKQGEYEKAKIKYYLAKDLDCTRFRASEDINEVIHKLANKNNATLVRMKGSFFEQVSPNRIIGNNLMTEHVHPNINGYFLMADAFFYSVAESKLLGDKLNIVLYKNSAYYQKNWGFTELDSLLGVHRVNSLKYYWPFQPFDAPFIDYRKIYKPVSIADSLAFAVIKSPENKINEAHLFLAEIYKKRGDFYNAYREYHAAIKCNPYQLKDYLEAANCLIKTNDFALALKFIDESLVLQESFYAYFMKAEILLTKGEYLQSVEFLNKALELDTKNEITISVLEKLYEAYFYTENLPKSTDIQNKLKQIKPGFEFQIPVKRPEYVFFVPVQVEKQIRHAADLYKTGKDDAALKILLNTLEIKETSIANRIIGDILFRKNDKNSILYFLKAYPDYNKDIDFLYDLGVQYSLLKVKDKAQEILQEMRTIDPKNTKIASLQEQLKLI